MLYNKKKILSNKKAFSLIEIMAVIMIIALGMVGVANLVTQSIQAQSLNKSNVIAHQLAQEGIELIRQVRDTNWVQGNPWNTNLSSGNYCIDYLSSSPLSISSPSDCHLYFNDHRYYSSQAGVGDQDTPFNRMITINDTSTTTMEVTSIITWTDRGRAYRYDVSTQLYDWR